MIRRVLLQLGYRIHNSSSEYILISLSPVDRIHAPTMGNGLYRINWSGIHFDRRTEVHPTFLRDVTVTASDNEAHGVEHAEVEAAQIVTASPGRPVSMWTSEVGLTTFWLVDWLTDSQYTANVASTASPCRQTVSSAKSVDHAERNSSSADSSASWRASTSRLLMSVTDHG